MRQQAVDAVELYLQANPDTARKYGRVRRRDLSDAQAPLEIGKALIANFLGGNWTVDRINLSLMRINRERDNRLSMGICFSPGKSSLSLRQPYP